MTAPREVCLLIGEGGRVLWADVGDSPAALPDARSRWEALWARREELVEVTHTHPVGPLAFSSEDTTTMSAVDAALGRPLTWSVVAPTGMVRISAGGDAEVEHNEPWWTALLRAASGMTNERGSRWPS